MISIRRWWRRHNAPSRARDARCAGAHTSWPGLIDYAARAERRFEKERSERLRIRGVDGGAHRPRGARARRRCAAPPASTRSPRRARARRGEHEAPRSRPACRRRGAPRAVGRPSVPVILLEPEGDVEGGPPPGPVDLRSLPERDGAPAVAAVLSAREIAGASVHDRCRSDRFRRGHEQRRLRVSETERREPRKLLGQTKRQVLRQDDSVDRTTSNSSSGSRFASAYAAKSSCAAILDSSIDRPAAAGVRRIARGSPSMPTTLRGGRTGDRPSRPLPRVVRTRDQHDRPVEPLGQP